MDIVSPDKRSAMMRAVKGKDTKPEMAVRRLVHRLGYRFRLHVKTLPGKPDLVFPGKKRIIFVHGCFWHRHPGCRRAAIPETNREFWLQKLSGNVLRDAWVQDELRALGWGILVVWACEIKDEDALAEKLIGFLGSRKRDTKSVRVPGEGDSFDET